MNYVNEIQVLYKPKLHDNALTQICNTEDASEFLKTIWEDDIEYRERFYAVYLNRANLILGYYLIGIGSSCGVVVDTKMIFQPAINLHASSIILAHNHPSGNTKPSEADRKFTSRIIEAGKLLEITIWDHIIITTNSFYSFLNN